MGHRRDQSRVLIYSHDSFGLGHLRRCRTIAHALVDRHKDMSVLILSGSPIIGSFDFRSRVDFVRIPGVIKLRNGEYTPLNLHNIDIEETLAMRASIIRHTADIFDPDLFIVDKEPLGLRGEVTDTLHLLKNRGTRRHGRTLGAGAGMAAQECLAGARPAL
jgi:predicted glycosyltransferase